MSSLEPDAIVPDRRAVALDALVEAGSAFVVTVRGVDASQWDDPGLGEWTVRELAAHTARGLRVIGQYLTIPDADDEVAIELPSAAAYFRAALSMPDVNAGIADRGRQSALEIGAALPTVAGEWLAEVVELVRAAPPDAYVRHFAGTIALPDYLETRVVEVVVHTADLAAATGQPPPTVGPAVRLTLDVLAATVPDESAVPVMLALAGRGRLPAGFSAFDPAPRG
jgi:uncharacterized protein (TIGR03083 family)